jgi:hypothetical protein
VQGELLEEAAVVLAQRRLGPRAPLSHEPDVAAPHRQRRDDEAAAGAQSLRRLVRNAATSAPLPHQSM